MSAWTFIAQRATTREFLHWDLPLDLDSLGWELSGPGALTATLAPDVGGLRDDGGRLLLEEWGTIIYAEHGGQIRWAGIVVSCAFQGEKWSLECSGFGGYPHAVTYRGEFVQVGVDPAEAFRHIWQHLQSFPDSDLGVVVTGDSTPIRLGTPATDPALAAKAKAADAIADRLEGADTYYEDWTWQGCPQEVADWNDDLLREYGGPWDDRVAGAAWLRNYLEAHPVEEAKPYSLVWWDSPNCGSELDDLAKTAPFDWVEEHRWATVDPEDVTHEVRIGYPRVGRRRDDLVFIQGDNVTEVVSVESNGDDFANTVLGLGAGEGQAMLRRETAVRDGRLRRDHVYADKAVTDASRLDALIADELSARRAALRITSLSVTDHPNAPIGSWQLGDDVLVRAELPWLGEVEVWVRITGWSLTGEHTATLTVSRSDLFRYGG